MLEKDKKCIEFSMHSMVVTHKPYQEDSEITITGMAPGKSLLWANNPFDIPCDVVVISKRDFERLQVENEELKKKLSEFEPIPGYREFLTALYPGEDVEKLVWATEQLCCGRDLRHALQVDLEYYRTMSSAQAKSNESLSELARQREINYKFLLKRTGFDSEAELMNYLNYEAECDNLYEAISKLHDEVKYNNDKCVVLEQKVKVYAKALQDWKEGTGCPSPLEAKNLIEETKNANEKLDVIATAWRTVTGYSTPEDYLAAKIRTVYVKLEPSNVTWRDATGCPTPEAAKSHIKGLENAVRLTNKNMQKELEREIDAWQKATGCKTPEEAETTLGNLRGRIDEIKELAAIASNWTDRIEEV